MPGHPERAQGGRVVTLCRTVADVLAAADRDSKSDPPLSQATADLVGAILSSRQPLIRAAS